MRSTPALEPPVPAHAPNRAQTLDPEPTGALYDKPAEWAGQEVLNVAASGRFFSDRTIAAYAGIRRVEPCPLP